MNHIEPLTRSQLRDQIRTFITDTFLFGEPDPRVTDESSLLDTGTVDSTGVLEVVAFVESTFGFRLEDGEMTQENLDSIDRIARFVERKLSENRKT